MVSVVKICYSFWLPRKWTPFLFLRKSLHYDSQRDSFQLLKLKNIDYYFFFFFLQLVHGFAAYIKWNNSTNKIIHPLLKLKVDETSEMANICLWQQLQEGKFLEWWGTVIRDDPVGHSSYLGLGSCIMIWKVVPGCTTWCYDPSEITKVAQYSLIKLYTILTSKNGIQLILNQKNFDGLLFNLDVLIAMSCDYYCLENIQISVYIQLGFPLI